ncbi:MAG: homoserine O-acetyltransferase [Thermodesulfovibrionales bacterium]|nr:homoserine O-acetyltransferase [Thermodesulfovibrionales bacterium]
MKTQSEIGIVETKYFTFAEGEDKITLSSGEKFGPITVAYETYGELNEDKSNAILILHALSGDAHAAGYHKGSKKPGWWHKMIGSGRAFDTDKYFVICSNVLGGCKGTTGPISLNPETKEPYGLSFPIITIRDMVKVQNRLISHLGIKKLLCVAGGSMGGMQALQWMVSYPNKIESAIVIASTLKHSAQQIAFNEVGRQAVMADPYWKGGYYYGGHIPAKGLAVARMLGHITYMSEKSMEEKFGRQRKSPTTPFRFTADFEVENYLHYKGDRFVERFDANSYLYITKAIDLFDLTSCSKPIHEIFSKLTAKVLVIAFKSDWLYPVHQSKEIAKACKMAGLQTTFCEIDSDYGHDAFLLEIDEESHLISHFLEKVYKDVENRH